MRSMAHLPTRGRAKQRPNRELPKLLSLGIARMIRNLVRIGWTILVNYFLSISFLILRAGEGPASASISPTWTEVADWISSRRPLAECGAALCGRPVMLLRRKPLARGAIVPVVQFDTDPVPAKLVSCCQCRSAAAKRVQHKAARLREGLDQRGQCLNRLLRWV